DRFAKRIGSDLRSCVARSASRPLEVPQASAVARLRPLETPDAAQLPARRRRRSSGHETAEATVDLLGAMDPSGHRKAAIPEGMRRNADRKHFVFISAREKDAD